MSRTSDPPRILVTGATGRLGRLLVPRLLLRGATVRALTRQPARADALRGLGVEPVVGDLDVPGDLQRALDGVTHLFLLSPISPQLAEQQIAAIDSAAAAGVDRIVKLSGSHWTIEPPGRSLSGDAHGAIEAALRASNIAHRVLRPNAWTQVMLAKVADELARGEVLSAPPGDPRVAFIDARDIADVAVEALFEAQPPAQVPGGSPSLAAPAKALQAPSPLASPTPWVLTGSRAVGYGELARIASQLTGRKILARPLSAEAQQARQAASAPTPHIARVHAEFARLIGAGEASAVTSTVAEVLGRPARTVEAFLAESLATHAPA